MNPIAVEFDFIKEIHTEKLNLTNPHEKGIRNTENIKDIRGSSKVTKKKRND